MAVMTQWANENAHVDGTKIGALQFTNSAHTVIYAKVHSSAVSEFRAIGVVQGWQFTEQRQVEEIFELGSDIQYIIPGRTTGQISINRLLISGADLINTLYGADAAENGRDGETQIRSLRDITKPLDLLFVAYSADPNEVNRENTVRYFDSCWIVTRQEQIGANQVVVAESCTIMYEKMDTAFTLPNI